MNANAVLRTLDKKGGLSIEEQESYAQALAMRAYCYYSIANLYGPSPTDETKSQYGRHGSAADFDLAPIYTQNDTTSTGLVKEQPLSTLYEVRMFVRDDLAKAIELFDETGFSRPSKLYIDGDVARALQAYNYLQMAYFMPTDGLITPETCYQEAYNHAQEVIDHGQFEIMPYKDVLTTGFVDVKAKSWMWGLDVTQENRTGLASFWGHMDVHTYSYAFAGATKGCDANLYNDIPPCSSDLVNNDVRKNWFNADKKFIPDGKFYDLDKGETADEIDRDWLNDIVYMRIEEMYLIAAEASYRAGDVATAKARLQSILDERFVNTVDLSTYYGGNLLKQIYMNWRIELWGEGRSLITWKRFSIDGADYSQKFRGANHYSMSGEQVKSTDYIKVCYVMPSSEALYNNEIAD